MRKTWLTTLMVLAWVMTGAAQGGVVAPIAPPIAPPMASASKQALPAAPQGVGLPISIRPIRIALYGAKVSRLRYWTADPLHPGRRIVASALLLLPQAPAPEQGWPVLAWDHGTSGFAVTCGPSVRGYSPGETRFLERWIAAGFAIVAPDYIGMGERGPNLYLDARSEGVATLDALRAALRAAPRLRNEVIIDGHSQGGQAAIAAAGLVPSYAPELRVRGAIAVAPPYFDTQAQQALPGAAGPGFALYMMFLAHAWQQAHPDFDPASLFTPQAASYVRQAGQRCLQPLYRDLAHSGLTAAAVVTPRARRMLPAILAWAAYPSLSLSMPLFIATGSADRIVSPASQLRLAGAACRAGSQVVFHLYPGLDHIATRDESQEDAVAFAQQRLAGKGAITSCPIPDNLSLQN